MCMRPQFFRREWLRHVATTTVHRGTAFEERSMKLLQDNLSMSLQRVGGREDGGIDLQGWWWLPPTSMSSTKSDDLSTPRRRLRIIAQCKAEKKKTSPKYVRELEGVMLRFSSVSTGQPNSLHDVRFSREDFASASEYPLVAVLVSESPFTKSTLLRAHSSPLPLFLLHIPPLRACQDNGIEDDVPSTANMGSAFWNPALGGPRGVLEGEMEIRWERSSDTHGRPGIWWRNRRLENWVPDNDISHTGAKREANDSNHGKPTGATVLASVKY